jgi:hypothetical protein
VRVWKTSGFALHDQVKRCQLVGWEAKIERQLKRVVARGDRCDGGGRNWD